MPTTEPAKAEREVERTRKWLLGCSLGCAGLLLLVLLMLLAVFFWLQAASPLPAPEAFVDEHTTAFALARPNMAEAAVRAAVTDLLRELPKSLPKELAPIAPMVTRATRQQAGSEEVRPFQIIWTLSRRPEAESTSYLVVVSIDRFKGIFTILRRGLSRASAPELGASVTRERHGKTSILIFQRPQEKTVTATAIFGTSVLISNDPQEIRRALDRFTHAPAEFRGPPALNQLYRNRPGPTEGFLLLLNEHSELPELIAKAMGDAYTVPEEGLDWDAIRSIQCSAQITPQGTLKVVGTANFRPGAPSEAVEEFAREFLKSLEEKGNISESTVEFGADSLRGEAVLPLPPSDEDFPD